MPPKNPQKAVKKFNLLSEKIHFNKKFRNRTRKEFANILESSMQILEQTRGTTLKDSKDRLQAEMFIDIANKFIKTCDIAEEQQKFYNQTGKFILFKKGNNYIFNVKTLRDKKIREGNLNFQNGLPKGKNKNAILQKEAVNLDKYLAVDSGKYRLKQQNFAKGYFHFWGKKRKYFINFEKKKVVTEKIINLICKDVSI